MTKKKRRLIRHFISINLKLSLIMIACLQKINFRIADEINYSMFLG
jgi:hypothetical protein